MLSRKPTINGGAAASSKAVYVNETSVSLTLKRTNSSGDAPAPKKYKQDERKKRELANPVVQKRAADVGGNAGIDFTSLPLESIQEILTYCDVKDLGNVSVTYVAAKEITASKLHVLKAWWTQLEHVVHIGDADAGIASCRRLFHNKVPLATWNNQGMFLSACEKMLGAMYNMTCSYMEDKNSFSVARPTPGLAYLDPIKNACRANYLDRLNILIDGGYDLNKTDGNGWNALHWVALHGCRLDLFRRILENTADVNARDSEGKTALMLATQYSEQYSETEEFVKLLMTHPHIDVNLQNRYGMTALHLGVIYKRVSAITELLNGENIDCTLTNENGNTPLEMAVDSVRPECEQLLRAHGAPFYGSYQRAFETSNEHTEQSVDALLNMDRDPNEVDEHGRNVLHHAAWRGYSLPLFNRILEKIKDVNAVIDKDWRSALMLATRFHRVELVTALMNHPQIDLNVVGLNDRTVLHFAVLATVGNTDTAILELLCSDERVDYTFDDANGNTPLGLTKAYGRNLEKCAQILRAHGAPFYGCYHRAFEQNDEHTEESVYALLNMDRDPNEVDEHGWNALHLAAWRGCSVPLFEKILEKITDVNAATGLECGVGVAYEATGIDFIDCPVLFLAIRNNHLDLIKLLMGHPKIDLNVQGGNGNYTALHMAVNNDRPGILNLLLSDKRTNSSVIDGDGMTPLEYTYCRMSAGEECAETLRVRGAPFYGSYQRAFEANDEETEPSVEALLNMGRDPNEVDSGWAGNNALQVAAKKGCSLALFNRILEKIDNVNAANKVGVTALMFAAGNNHLDMVESLMKAEQIDLNFPDHYNFTALHRCVGCESHPAILRLLLSDERTDCSIMGNQLQRTPLEYAWCWKNTECVKILRAHGAPFYGFFEGAFEANDEETEQSVIDLLNMGRGPNKVDADKRNALHWLCIKKYNHSGIFHQIVSRIKDVNVVDRHGYTALMYAVHYGHNEAAKELICNPRVDLNIQGADGYTALHIAVYKNNIDIVKELCKKSVNCKLEDLTHRTPIQVAMQKRRPECEEIMRSVSEKALGESD